MWSHGGVSCGLIFLRHWSLFVVEHSNVCVSILLFFFLVFQNTVEVVQEEEEGGKNGEEKGSKVRIIYFFIYIS